jgi:hypothetical protein
MSLGHLWHNDLGTALLTSFEAEQSGLVDDSFPPTISSLVGKQCSDAAKRFLSRYQVAGWSRLSELCDEPVIFPEHICADDIIQSCALHIWFVQVVSSHASTFFSLSSTGCFCTHNTIGYAEKADFSWEDQPIRRLFSSVV